MLDGEKPNIAADPSASMPDASGIEASGIEVAGVEPSAVDVTAGEASGADVTLDVHAVRASSPVEAATRARLVNGILHFGLVARVYWTERRSSIGAVNAKDVGAHGFWRVHRRTRREEKSCERGAARSGPCSTRAAFLPTMSRSDVSPKLPRVLKVRQVE